jgi:hypothetical protein
MRKMPKAQQEAAARLAAALDAGIDYFGQHPEDDMTTIHRRASNIYRDSKDEALAYASGYLAARLKHDEFAK